MIQSSKYLHTDRLSSSQIAKLGDLVDLAALEDRLASFATDMSSCSGEQIGILKNTWKMDESIELRLKKIRAEREAAAAEMRRKQQEDRFRRLMCLFVVAAKMAKADGHVDASEVRVVERIFTKFNITNSERTRYVEAFNSAVKSSEDVYLYVDRIARDFPLETRAFIYELLWDLACADGVIVEAELNLLKNLCWRLRLSESAYHNNFASRRNYYKNDSSKSASSGGGQSDSGHGSNHFGHSHSVIAWAYTLIGGAEDMSNDELKAVYRTQAKAYHPDILRAKGIPEDLIELANAKMVKLNEAWALIQRDRGI